MAELTLPEAPEGYLFKLKGTVNYPYLELRKCTWLGSRVIVTHYMDYLSQRQLELAAGACKVYNNLRLSLKALR